MPLYLEDRLGPYALFSDFFSNIAIQAVSRATSTLVDWTFPGFNLEKGQTRHYMIDRCLSVLFSFKEKQPQEAVRL